jgi:uncharacterized protein (UPF0335 family)
VFALRGGRGDTTACAVLWMSAPALDLCQAAFESLRYRHREECPMSTAAAVKDDQPAHRFAKDQLKAFVERVERLEEEKKAIADDIRDVYGEAKANGFDTKALRTVVRLRKQDLNERKEQEAILETYLHALGMLS